MKKILSAGCVWFLLAAASPGLERSDLSPVAQALLPASSEVTVKLKNGSVLRGTLVSQDDKRVVLKRMQGSIVTENAYPRADVVSVTGVDLCEQFAQAIDAIRFDPAKELSEEDYAKFISLLDEFAAKCGTRAEVKSAQEKSKFLKAELDRLRLGLKKIGGQWLPPVAAAVRRFDLYTDQLKKLEPYNNPSNPRGQQAYEQIQQSRRDVGRGLPELVSTRIPLLLQGQRFDEAIAEMNAFLSFWISRVVKVEAGQPDAERMRQVLAGMDFKYFVRLQKQIMEAYRPTVEAGSPPALAEGEVYVPGGYFLMGNEEAGIDDNTFPYRIVWVSPFAMDKFEVSNAQYRKFLEHVQKTGDSSMEHPDAPPLKDHTPEGWKSDELKGDDQPVLGVDWFDAYAYAKWAGKRLPTEAEWEKAARGADGRKYIWGNDPILQRIENFPAGRDYVVSEVNRQRPPPPAPKKEGLFDKPEEVQAQPPFALPVATWPVAGRLPPGAPESNFPDLTNAPSVYGLYHLAGNAAEWVDDYYYAGAYQSDCWRDPPCVTTGSAHSVRGASYLGPSDGLPVFARLFDPSDHFKNGLDASGKPMAGIRCARSLTEPTR